MKKKLALVLAALLVLGLAACGTPAPPAAGTGGTPPPETTSPGPDMSEPPETTSPEPDSSEPPETTPPEPDVSEPPEIPSSLRVPVPPEDWVAPVHEWGKPYDSLFHVDYSFWREEADGWQLVAGLWDDTVPPLTEETQEESWEEPSLTSPDLPAGYWRQLTWPGLELLCYHCGPERDVVLSITVTDPEIVTFRGVHVGCTLEELLSTQGEGCMGERYSEPGNYSYVPAEWCGTYAPLLIFRFEDGVIYEIHVEYYAVSSQ